MNRTEATRIGVGVGQARARRPRRVALLIGSALVAASGVACGGNGDDAAVEATREPTVTTTATTPATTTPSAPAAPADDSISPAASQSITVGGMGADYGPPTRAVVDLGIDVRRPTVREASDQAAVSGEALVAALTAAGVPATAIQTSEFGINPTHDQFDYNRVIGYEVHLGYRATVPDVGSLGAVLAAAVDAGGDSVRAWGIRFEGDPEQHMEAARAAAWDDLRLRAESTAAHAGATLGELIDVHEKVLLTTPQGMMQGGEGDSATFDIPVSPGQVGVVVLLTATYAVDSETSDT